MYFVHKGKNKENKLMEKELQLAKEKLKKIEQTPSKTHLIQNETYIEDPEKMKSQFFASGVQNWFEIYKSLTFPSFFLDLKKEAAEQIIFEHANFLKNGVFSKEMFANETPLSLLAKEIDIKI